MWLYLAIQAGALGSRLLPLNWRYRISTVLGDLIWLVWSSKRRTCIENMSVVLGKDSMDASVRRTARRSFQHFAKGIVDFLGYSNIQPEDPFVAEMPISGWEHVTAALDRGKGVVLATAHFGSIDLGALALSRRCPDFHAVADTFHPRSVDELVRRTRESKGLRLIPTASVRRVMRALRDNALVVVLFDRPMPRAEGVPVRFFGRETAMPGGPAIMALRMDAAVLPAFVFRQEDNRLHGRVFPPVTEGLFGDKARNAGVIMQRLADTLQSVVSETPEQWYMFRPMWPEAPGHESRHVREASAEVG